MLTPKSKRHTRVEADLSHGLVMTSHVQCSASGFGVGVDKSETPTSSMEKISVQSKMLALQRLG